MNEKEVDVGVVFFIYMEMTDIFKDVNMDIY